MNRNDSISSALAYKEEEEDSIEIARGNYSCLKCYNVDNLYMVYDGRCYPQNTKIERNKKGQKALHVEQFECSNYRVMLLVGVNLV